MYKSTSFISPSKNVFQKSVKAMDDTGWHYYNLHKFYSEILKQIWDNICLKGWIDAYTYI